MAVIKSSNILVENWLSIARDKHTSSDQFRLAIDNIGILLFSEAIGNMNALVVKKRIKTPIKAIQGRFLNEKNIYIVPVLRAGQAMLTGIKRLVPEAKVAHVGLYRNEKTLQPKWYLDKLPKKISKRSVFFILEPMLATGGTITTVLQRIIILGANKVNVIGVLMSEHARKTLEKNFQIVNFYIAGVDPDLNSKGYIVPGLGDAGDRAFNM